MRFRRFIIIACVLVAVTGLGSVALVFRWQQATNADNESLVQVLYAILFAILFIAFIFAWNWLFIGRSKSVLRKWAAEHGYEILRSENPFRSGAFSFWSTSRSQVVYLVTVRDGSGLERAAWVRCGIFNDEIEVMWNDKTDTPR